MAVFFSEKITVVLKGACFVGNTVLISFCLLVEGIQVLRYRQTLCIGDVIIRLDGPDKNKKINLQDFIRFKVEVPIGGFQKTRGLTEVLLTVVIHI